MAKLRIYLDTSVLSAYHDDQWPDRMRLTREFWERQHEFDASTSVWTKNEIGKTQNAERRLQMEALLSTVSVFEVTNEMRTLAETYVREEAFTTRMVDDAIHLAAAVQTRQDILVSWNFRHLVNRRRILKIRQINAFLRIAGNRDYGAA